MNNGSKLLKDKSPRRRDQISFISLLPIYIFNKREGTLYIYIKFLNTYFMKECHLLQNSRIVLET